MRYRKIVYIVLFCLTTLISQAQIHDKVSINLADFESEKIQEFDKVTWKSDFKTFEVGMPELPVYRVSYVLPINAKFTGVTFSLKEKQLLKKDIYIYPVQPPIPLDNTKSIDFKQPDEKTYNSDEPYPGTLYKLESDDIYQGYHIVTLEIFPFEYIPKSRKLHYYPDLEYTIEYDNVSPSVTTMSERQTVTRAELSKKAVKNIVKNTQDVESFGSNVISTNDTKKTVKSGMQKTKSISISDDIVPDYIIITSESLKAAFKPLADWKTKKGLFAIIKTTEDIAASFTGSDLQEKIRNYLISAYGKWGATIFVLLGGNIDIVPSRYVSGVEVGDKTGYPTDKYYSTSTEGVGGGSLFNYIGRIPVSNTTETNTYVNKLIHYEKADSLGDLNYLKNNLYADAYLEYGTNGTLCSYHNDSIKSYVHNKVPNDGSFNNVFMCDNANCSTSAKYTTPGSDCANGNINWNIEFNRNNFLSCLNSGSSLVNGKFHFIYHEDHCSSLGMGTSSKDKGEGILVPDMENLSNGNSYQILFSNGCHPANFKFNNCMGTRYIINAQGGVAFIGNTDIGWQDEYPQLKGFLQSVYKSGRYDIGNAFQNALLNYSSNTDFSSWKLHLLGDPEMQVWTGVPTTLTVLLSSPAVAIGQRTDTITLSNLPKDVKAMICIQKGTEVYSIQQVTGTGSTMKIPMNFTVITPGTVNVTVTAHNFKPFESIITVNSTNNPNLSVSTVDFGDGIVSGVGKGNGNGQNDAGETINLTLGIKNTGVNTANGVTATLSSSSPFISISSSQGNFGNIGSGATATSNQFTYTIQKGAPGKDASGVARPECLANDQNPVTFTVTIKDATNTTWTQKYNIDVFKDSLIQCNKTFVTITNGHLVPQAGDDVTMHIALQNIGKAAFLGDNAVLTSTNTSYCTINSGNSNYSSIAPMEIKDDNATFSFHTTTNNTVYMKFNLKVTNAYGKEWNFPFTLYRNVAISDANIGFTPSQTEITLNWVSPIYNTNIYRCDIDSVTKLPTGNYVKLNSNPITRGYYNDKGLKPWTLYSYKIVSLNYGNEGIPAFKTAWTSYPQINLFPVQMDGTVSSLDCPFNIADINYDGKKEIFTASSKSSNSRIVALNYLGNELNDIDNKVTTYDGFAGIDKGANGIPCVADIYRNGKLHVIEPTRSGSSDLLYSFSFDGAKNNDMDWKVGLMCPSYRGAVAANIDNSADGSMEIITTSENGPINIISNTGNILHTLNSAGGTYGAIAVADLDGKGKKQIIKASGQGIYIWNSDGSDYKGVINPYCSLPANSGYVFRGSVIVCDLHGNGHKEILCSALKPQAKDNIPSEGKIYAICTDVANTLDPTWIAPTIPYDDDWDSQEVTVGDLNNDGKLEVVAMSQSQVKIWNNVGTLINTIQVNNDIPVGKVAPILADVDNNHNDVEIIVGSNSTQINAYKIDGSQVIGFPLIGTGGFTETLAVADIDKDGKNEVIGSDGTGKVCVWKTNGIPSKIEWGSERHDQYNTGEYQTIYEPTLITANTTWNSNQSVNGDLIVKSGTLTINSNGNITLGTSSMIIVMAGASLVIDSGHILNANVRAMSGGNVTVKNNGSITLRSNAEFYTEPGTNLDIEYGGVDR
jgi:hypothetical protein